jgi:hypothetical protein
MQAVVVIGRFNPPTIGHESVFKTAIRVARKTNSRLVVFVSSSHDNKNNPLPVEEKITFLKTFFPGIDFRPMTNAYDAIKSLGDEGFDSVTLLTGSDRRESYTKMITSGMKKPDGDIHKISLKDFQIITLTRDPDSDDVSGASATKMREAAKNNNWNDFKNMAPNGGDELKKMLFDAVKRGLK